MDLRATTARWPVARALDAHMASHHGVLDLGRARHLGATPDLVQRYVEAGEWVQVHRGVYRGAAAPITAEQTLLAAVFASGEHALASHRSAAWLWNLLVRPPDRPDVVMPYGSTRYHHGIAVHRSTDLVGAPVVERRGIPTTDAARTVLDVAGVLRPAAVDLVIDRAIASKVCTLVEIVAALERYGRRGRRGAGRLRDALERRGVVAEGRVPSVLESQMARLVRLIDVPPPVPEYEVAGGRYRFDFAWPEIRVAVEVDGWDAHTSFDDWRRNLEKGNWASEHGWVVVHFSWDMVRHAPDKVAARLSSIIHRRSLRG
jgi:hypothetical protein